MARDFKMHRAAPAPGHARAGIAPLGGRPKKAAGRGQLAERSGPRLPDKGAPPRTAPVDEIGGPDGPEPTRYGDWERNGICYDF